MLKEERLEVSAKGLADPVWALQASFRSMLVHCSSAGWEPGSETVSSGASLALFSRAGAASFRGETRMGHAAAGAPEPALWGSPLLRLSPEETSSASRDAKCSGGRSPSVWKREVACSLMSSVKKQPALFGGGGREI